MKTKEFVEKVNALGCDVLFRPLDIEVEDSKGSTVLSVPKGRQYVVNSDWISFEFLNDAVQAELFEIAVYYASIKPEERE